MKATRLPSWGRSHTSSGKLTDVALGIGTRFMWHEMAWGVDDDLKLIQINADPTEINRRGNVEVPICALAEDALPLLIQALETRLGKVEDHTDRIADLNAAFDQRVRELQPTYDDLMVFDRYWVRTVSLSMT